MLWLIMCVKLCLCGESFFGYYVNILDVFCNF